MDGSVTDSLGAQCAHPLSRLTRAPVGTGYSEQCSRRPRCASSSGTCSPVGTHCPFRECEGECEGECASPGGREESTDCECHTRSQPEPIRVQCPQKDQLPA